MLFFAECSSEIRTEHLSIFQAHALSLTFKAINDTVGPRELVQTLLVFGVMPHISILPHQLPNQLKRKNAMKQAQDDTIKLIARSGVAIVIARNLKAAADSNIKIVEEVMLYKGKAMGKWTESL